MQTDNLRKDVKKDKKYILRKICFKTLNTTSHAK